MEPHPGSREASQHLRESADEVQEATFLELFFDLVFVFAVTQLSHRLLEHLTFRGAAATVFLLLVVWWAWIYTTWMTNWFDPESVAVRAVLVAVMLASLLMAIAIPDAFGDRAALFAVSYVALQLIRNVFIVVATDRALPMHTAYVRILAWSLMVGAVWITGVLVPESWLVPIWLAALALDYAAPLVGYWTPRLGRTTTTDFEIEGAHFAERFQLFIIIALGESIVVTGATASNLGLGPANVAALIVAFLGSAALWWLYFDEVAGHSSERLRTSGDTARLSRDAYTYLHIPIVAGIIATAVGDEIVIAHPGSELHGAELIVTIGGPALYLLGHALFRWRMTRTASSKRLGAMALLIALAPLAPHVPALATASLILAILTALAALETRGRIRADEAAMR